MNRYALPGDGDSAAARHKLRWEHAAAVGFLLLFTLVFFSPVFQGWTYGIVGGHMETEYPWYGNIERIPGTCGFGYPQTDHGDSYYPTSVLYTDALRRGEMLLWNPYNFGGIPITEVGSTTGPLFYPPRLLAMLALSPPWQAVALQFSHLLLAGLAMYALLRCWNVEVWGAIFGAVVWELNGHNAFWLCFEFVALTAAWLPLMLLGATLAVRRRSFGWSVATGVFTGLSILSGGLHWVYVGCLVLAVWFGFLCLAATWRDCKEGKYRSAVWCLSLPGIALLVALGVSAVLWVPLVGWIEFLHRQPPPGLVGLFPSPFSWREIGQAAFLLPRCFYEPTGPPDYPGFAFVGLPAMILAIFGCVRKLRSAPTWLGIGIAVFALTLVLGLYPLLVVFSAVVPGFRTFHGTIGFYPFGLAIAILSAFGLSELVRLLAARPRWRVALPAVLILLEATVLVCFAKRINPIQPIRADRFFPETPLIAKLRELQGEHRILQVHNRCPDGAWLPAVLVGRKPGIFELRAGFGYESLMPEHPARLWQTVANDGRPALEPFYSIVVPRLWYDRIPMDLLTKISVGLLVTPPDLRPKEIAGQDLVSTGALRLVYTGRDGFIYENPQALNRAYLVPQVVSVSTEADALKRFADPQFDARAAAIVVGDHPETELFLQPPADDVRQFQAQSRATITRDELHEVGIRAVCPRPALLVLNDTYAPGWKVRVDGQQQPVLSVNYAFRGVLLPAGEHEVSFRYHPRWFFVGLYISLGCGAVLLLGGVGFAIRTACRRCGGSAPTSR